MQRQSHWPSHAAGCAPRAPAPCWRCCWPLSGRASARDCWDGRVRAPDARPPPGAPHLADDRAGGGVGHQQLAVDLGVGGVGHQGLGEPLAQARVQAERRLAAGRGGFAAGGQAGHLRGSRGVSRPGDCVQGGQGGRGGPARAGRPVRPNEPAPAGPARRSPAPGGPKPGPPARSPCLLAARDCASCSGEHSCRPGAKLLADQALPAGPR